MVVMLLAGYLSPALVGLGAVALLLNGHGLGLLWALTALLALLLLQIRNFYGFVLVVCCGALLAVLSWFLSAPTQSALACLLTWVLLLSAPKPVLELIGRRRSGQAGRSDPDQLAALTRTPAGVWIAMFLVANVVGLIVGATLLLPALAELARSAVAAVG